MMGDLHHARFQLLRCTAGCQRAAEPQVQLFFLCHRDDIVGCLAYAVVEKAAGAVFIEDDQILPAGLPQVLLYPVQGVVARRSQKIRGKMIAAGGQL